MVVCCCREAWQESHRLNVLYSLFDGVTYTERPLCNARDKKWVLTVTVSKPKPDQQVPSELKDEQYESIQVSQVSKLEPLCLFAMA